MKQNNINTGKKTMKWKITVDCIGIIKRIYTDAQITHIFIWHTHIQFSWHTYYHKLLGQMEWNITNLRVLVFICSLTFGCRNRITIYRMGQNQCSPYMATWPAVYFKHFGVQQQQLHMAPNQYRQKQYTVRSLAHKPNTRKRKIVVTSFTCQYMLVISQQTQLVGLLHEFIYIYVCKT